MAQRFDPSQPAAERIRAVRDAYLIPTPDKTDTAYAVLTSAADDVAALLEAAREGLICAEADLECRRQSCAEYGEDPEQDQFYQVFKERRALIAAAIAKATGQAVPA